VNTVYQAHGTATGGRSGRAFTDDGKLDVRLATPRELGGPGGDGTNPEQLFACGYAACFDSALSFVARQQKLSPGETRVDATVGIGSNGTGGFNLAVHLFVTVAGLSRDQAKALIQEAHAICPYSNALRGNVEVVVELR